MDQQREDDNSRPSLGSKFHTQIDVCDRPCNSQLIYSALRRATLPVSVSLTRQGSKVCLSDNTLFA